jgi:hypothetical protein
MATRAERAHTTPGPRVQWLERRRLAGGWEVAKAGAKSSWLHRALATTLGPTT